MANIDVSELMADPDLTDRIQITRNVQTVDVTGTVQQPSPQVFNAWAVVQPASGESLAQLPDMERVQGAIDVWSIFEFALATTTTSPDTITWNGRNYLVQNVQRYNNYGRGYFRATCTMIGLVDPVTPPPTPPYPL